MSFNIVQKPERITPSNTEHVYTIYSTLSNEDSYKFIVDVWLNPYVPTDQRLIARIKSRPNANGALIVDIQQIIKDALNPNIRIEADDDVSQTKIGMWRGSQSFDSFYTTKPTLMSGFSKANGGSEPGDSVQAGVESKLHLTEYRIMIGEEYVDSLGTTITNISNGVGFIQDDGYVLRNMIGSYPAQYPSVSWYDYYGDISGNFTGVTIEWYDSTETTLKGGTSSTAVTGNYETPTQPVVNDKLIVRSIYSGKEVVWQWTEDGETLEGWRFVEVRYSQPYWYGQFMPESVISWVGTENQLVNPEYFVSWYNPNNRNGHLYDWYKWYMDSQFGPQTGQFLNIASEPYEVDNNGYVNTYRKRSLYVGEPIMVSFFNGYCGEFVNDLRILSLKYKRKTDPAGTYNGILEYIIKDHGAGPLVNWNDTYPSISREHIGNRLLHYTNNEIWFNRDNVEWVEINTWNGTSANPNDALDYEQTASEILRYEVRDVSCFEAPVYFVFLNQNGAWDTFTFGARSVKSYNVDRKTYSTSTYKGSTLYSRQSWNPSKVVYDSNIVVGLTAQTEYLQEYDSRIVEDLIRSNEVYIIENQQIKDVVDENKIPTLIPVNVLTSSVEEYNKNFQKLFQHTIQVEYNNITGYKSSL